jgi:thiosulfate/3-mercaptopyruvate sulfurtransferase
MLITTQQLAEHLSDPSWIVLDCRHDLMNHAYGREQYGKGRIPGAVFVDIEADLAAPKTGQNGRHPLPAADVLAAMFASKGVARDMQVVVYDDAGHNYSVRAWWSLSWLGHARVALLDGGYPKWLAEGRPASADALPVRPRGDFTAAPDLAGTVDLAYMIEQHASSNMRVLDARTAERFRGEQEPIDPVAGRIPGALNRWFKHNLNADGTFKSVAQLRAEFEPLLAGVAPQRVVHQCGSGVTACHNLFAMEYAGLRGSRLYPGSWSEWCADAARPVARG